MNQLKNATGALTNLLDYAYQQLCNKYEPGGVTLTKFLLASVASSSINGVIRLHGWSNTRAFFDSVDDSISHRGFPAISVQCIGWWYRSLPVIFFTIGVANQ